LAWLALGATDKANHIFQKLVAYGEDHLHDEAKIDYFAVSLPDLLIFEDDLQKRHQIHCQYMMGLGYLGLKRLPEAISAFHSAMDQDAMHFGAAWHLPYALELEEKPVNKLSH